MEKLETLVKKGQKDLEANMYVTFSRNGVSPMQIAKALDSIREAERVLRQAYGS